MRNLGLINIFKVPAFCWGFFVINWNTDETNLIDFHGFFSIKRLEYSKDNLCQSV